MSSASFFKTKEEYDEFIEATRSTKEIIRQKIEPYKNKPIIVLTGMMGVGKSCISCCLSNKNLIIEGKGMCTHLVGEGVGVGMNACTTIPNINYNSKNDFVIVDLPGFEDNRNYQQELLNSIAIDNLFGLFPNYTIKYKIILVFTSYDFKTKKGSILINSFSRLMKMFPNYKKIRNTLAIIITKGQYDYDSSDYINFFNETFQFTQNSTYEMEEVYNFLRSYQNNIFVFPQPLGENVGKPYYFKDFERLLTFCKFNYCINPEHRIALSKEAESELILSYENDKKNLIKSINGICQKIRSQYQKVKDYSNIQKWTEFIYKIMNTKIDTIKDFEETIKKNIPSIYIYDNDFGYLNKFNSFEKLVFQILSLNNGTTYVSNMVRMWCYDSLPELDKQKKIAFEIAEKERKHKEEERKREEMERKRREIKEIEEKYKAELERKRQKEEEYTRKKLEIQRRIQRVSGG